MKVLILSIPLSIPSGAAIMPQRLFRGLNKNGVEARMITHWWDCGFEPLIRYSVISGSDYRTFFRTRDMNGKPLAKVEEWRNVITPGGRRRIPHRIKTQVSRHQLILTGRKVIGDVCRYLSAKGYSPDLIHVHTHTFAYDGTLNEISDYFGNPPVVYTLHAVIGDVLKERELAQNLTLSSSDSAITISDGWRRLIQKRYQIKCELIHNATDYTLYTYDEKVKERARQLYGELNPEGSRLLLFSGRVEKLKIQGLAKAFSDLANEMDIKLVIMGENESDATIANLVRWGLRKEHAGKVMFTGWLDGTSEDGRREIAAHYRMINIDGKSPIGALVMPVRTEEHYGLSVLDAIAMRIPVVSCKGRLSTIGCLPDADSLRIAISSVFSNMEETMKRIEDSYRILKEEYSVEGYYVPQHISLYRDMISRKAGKEKNFRKKQKSKREIIEIIRKREEERKRKIMETIIRREEERKRKIMKEIVRREKNR